MRLSTVDRWVVGYAVFASSFGLILGKGGLPPWYSHALHLAAVAMALGVARRVPESGRWWPFFRYGYPVILFGFLYQDTGHYVFLLFDHWFDPALIAFEQSLLGFNVAAAIASVHRPWLLDFWMFGYLFYYLMPPLVVITMLVLNRPDVFRRWSVAACAAFFVSYAMFFFFPLEGPRYALADVLPPLQGVIFFPLVMAIQNSGSIHGGCMPSSHTAVAWVVTYYVYRVHRALGIALIVISTILSVGCFWGRFHYVTDVVVGLAIFGVTVWLTERYNRTPPPGAPSARKVPQTGMSA